jgi:hypothetical protein
MTDPLTALHRTLERAAERGRRELRAELARLHVFQRRAIGRERRAALFAIAEQARQSTRAVSTAPATPQGSDVKREGGGR